MNLLNSRINRRTLGGITIGAAAASGLHLASAQDATPEVAEEEVAATLATLESAAQFDVIANANSYAIFQAGDNVPGWYVFNVENASEAPASFNLARLPEEVGVGDFTTFLFQMNTGALTEMPAWVADTVFAGGVYVPVGGSNSVMLHLDAGKWVAFSNLSVSTQSATTITVGEPVAEEGAEAAATPEVAEETVVTAPEGFGSSFTVSIADGAIAADAGPAVGYNVIGVRNDATQPGNFVLLHTAEAVEADAAADLATAFLAGEETGAEVAGGMGVLSSGAFGYVELDAVAGTYVGFSSVSNASGTRQLEDGAITVFTV